MSSLVMNQSLMKKRKEKSIRKNKSTTKYYETCKTHCCKCVWFMYENWVWATRAKFQDMASEPLWQKVIFFFLKDKYKMRGN